MHITKMHGAGNDFIIINNITEKFEEKLLPELARKLCAQHTGIGADGLMLVKNSSKSAELAMLFYNSDGSLGEMCGNGARCICRYAYENGLSGEIQRVETSSGIIEGKRLDKSRYRIRLNDPSFIQLHRAVEFKGKIYDSSYVELGVPGLPHAVVRLDNWEDMERDELRELGRALRFASVYPKGANVSFVKKIGDNRLRAITFERGVEDFTLACGTGCGCIVTSLTLLELVDGENVAVEMPGGLLEIGLTRNLDTISDIMLTGPTAKVFEAELFDI